MNDVNDGEDDNEKQRRKALGHPLDGTEPVTRLTRMNDAMKLGFQMSVAGQPVNPLRTGFRELDERMRRYGPKEVTMLAADSGIGKSTIATQTALHTGACGHGAVYINLEMPDEMFGLRTGANFAKLPVKKAAAGELNKLDISRLGDAFRELKDPAKRIVLGNAREHRSIAAIKELCREAKRQLENEGAPLKLIIVDHILQVLVSVKNDKDAEGKARADMLKELAEDLDVHVIALVHVTRDGSKGGKMPTKNEMASSAWFDRHADNIFIFHQKRSPDGTFAPNAKAMLSAQKCRWGSPFAVELEYKQGFFFPWQLDRIEDLKGQEDDS